ncbi:MAG TPA: hypothetical protein VFS43_03240 [Polyangiaceae bacterium]|nr:hypothetical protein [Polyangiaceae bacterium]
MAIELRPWPWPWGFGPLVRPHPGRARLVARLRAEYREGAGENAPLSRVGQGYVGPGFALEGRGGFDYDVALQDAPSLRGALAALLVDLGRQASLLLVHGASVAFGGRAFCWAGPSGAGKSTWVRRHARRALGSNAALLWPEAGAWWAQALPLTGKGDAAVAPQGLPLGGLWVAGAPRRRPRALVEAMAWLASAVATARGLGPRLDLIEALARAHAPRGRGVFQAPGGPRGAPCGGAEHSLAS